MKKVTDHRKYKGDKRFCNVPFNYDEQKKCACFHPYIRWRSCTFRFSANRCSCNVVLTEEKIPMVYIVGRLEPKGDRVLLEVDGVFDNYERAVETCKTARHFIGPVPLNQTLPKEGIAWPGMHYPQGRPD